MRLIDLTGQQFGRLTVIKREDGRWRCRCICGNEKVIIGTVLKNGSSKSCGCYRIERGREHGAHIQLRHGEGANGRESHEYRTWASMRSRCNDTRHPQFARYGGRGITICDRWNRYETFLLDMGRRPDESHSLDRIDNDGSYSPENCQWTTSTGQNRNTSANHRISINGETKCLAEWLEEFGLARSTFRHRIRAGLTDVEALTEPIIRYPKTTKGTFKRPLYNTWLGIKDRCSNPNNVAFPDYGGRGITVSPQWRDSFDTFADDVGPKPSRNHSLDRIDNSGNYEPRNVRWATAQEQSRNQRGNHLIAIDGQTRPLIEWLEHFERNPATFYARVRKGWSEEAALKTRLLKPHEGKHVHHHLPSED